MARLISKSEIKIGGPWLLNKENTFKLNDILEKAKSSLEEDFNQLIEQKVDEELSFDKKNTYDSKESLKNQILNRYEFKVEDKATITTSEEDILHGKSLYELLKSKELEKVTPKRLTYQIKRGPSEVLLNFSESTYFGGLEFRFSITDESILEDVKYQIQNWIDDNKPKKAIKIWSYFGILGSFLIFLLAATLFYTYNGSNNPIAKYQSDLVKESNIILDSGLNNNEQNKALELILKYHEAEAGYVPLEYFNRLSNYSLLIKISIIYLIVVIVLSIRTPRPFIGLGKNEKQAQFRKWWYRIVTFSIPTILIIPWIREFINFLLKL